MLKLLWKRKILIAFLLAATTTAVLFSVNLHIKNRSTLYIFKNANDLPQTQVALILGARVYQDGRLSDILADRTIKALALYQKGKVSKFLVSGDNSRNDYNEVAAVKEYLLEKGVPEKDIFLDHAGFDTYDSLYRTRDIFRVKSLTVVTQEFHLPRAVYIGNSLGLETYGFIADRQPYVAARWNSLRESLARLKAFFNVTFHSRPKFLGPAIPISG